MADDRTVDEVRGYLSRRMVPGMVTQCPCCEQNVRVWKKSLISGAVASLVKLVSMYDGTFPVHFEKFRVDHTDTNYAQLRWWNLIISAKKRSSLVNASGEWFPTQLGIRIAHREVKVHQYVVTYNNTFVRFEGDMIDVVQALKKEFDYAELIQSQ